jgi:hypothetical protein
MSTAATFHDYYTEVVESDPIGEESWTPATMEQLFAMVVPYVGKTIATDAWYSAMKMADMPASYRGDGGPRPVTKQARWFGYLMKNWPHA